MMIICPRYAYVSSGTGQSPPTLVTVNGQTVQVVGSLQGNLGGLHPSLIQPGSGLHPLQTAPVQPQQFYPPPPDPGLLQRPQSFAPARFSPRSEPEPGEAEPDTGGQRPGAENNAKRDSFSDSGQDSGHNTPTRGRTITEGLLRFVQDSSVARPQLRQQELAPVASVALMPGVRPNLGQPQTPSYQQQQLQAYQLGQHQALTAGVPAGYVLQNANNMVLQQQLQTLQQTPGGYNTILEGAKVTGRDSVPLHVPQLPVSGRESVPLGAPVVSLPSHAGQLPPGPGRDSVPGRESVQSMPVALPALPGRESVPLGAPGQGHGGRDSVQSVPVPVIQSLGPHAPLSVLQHPAYIGPGHSMVTLPAQTQYGVKLGTPPSNYIGVPGGGAVMPGYPAPATAQYNPYTLQPPTSGLYSGEPVTVMRQPIMSTVSQPSSYLQSHHHLATNLQPMPLLQYHHPQYHQPAPPPQLASYPNGVAAVSAPGGLLPQHSLTGSFHESQGPIPVKDEAQVSFRNAQRYLVSGTQPLSHFILGS